MGASSKKLFGAILLFILLDLSALAINYRMAYQISKDAVAINLAGRQRMLSQRITKSLLLMDLQSSQNARATEEELRNSFRMFDETLSAFKHGGPAIGGNGNTVMLDKTNSNQADHLVDQALQIWHPIHERMLPYMAAHTDIPASAIADVRNRMIRDNLLLLDLMNQLTSSLEQDSLNRSNALRITQTSIFLLALLNFLMIVRRFHLLARQSAQTTQHYNELAMRDPLTGLFNRRQLENNLEREAATINRGRQGNIALVMIDLDGFKPINDRYGHEVGDIVLRTIATRLTESARVNDTIARIGGDEFTLICPDLRNKENADAFCQRLLDSLNRPIPTRAGPVQVGASIGIAFYPDHAENVDDLIRVADKTMYAAKNAGRNCYICFDPSQPGIQASLI
ncbi:MAG: diguanylate cyclase [Sulfuriferula sp.]|nr:diguanylate cyclase [Sulfuriferula sp.]